MGVSEQCKAAMIEHGVLIKDGKPAGANLMNKNTLRVALVEGGEDGRLPKDMDTNAIIKALPDEFLDSFLYGGRFPNNIKDLARDGLGFWYGKNVEIEFVNHNQSPDLIIASVFMTGSLALSSSGFASLPLHDPADIDLRGYKGSSDIALIGINEISTSLAKIHQHVEDPTSQGNSTILNSFYREIIKHEFGHNLGILHPDDAIDLASKLLPDACSPEEEKVDHQQSSGIMSYGENVESWYDRGTKEFVQTGILPNPSGGAKP